MTDPQLVTCRCLAATSSHIYSHSRNRHACSISNLLVGHHHPDMHRRLIFLDNPLLLASLENSTASCICIHTSQHFSEPVFRPLSRRTAKLYRAAAAKYQKAAKLLGSSYSPDRPDLLRTALAPQLRPRPTTSLPQPDNSHNTATAPSHHHDYSPANIGDTTGHTHANRGTPITRCS